MTGLIAGFVFALTPAQAVEVRRRRALGVSVAALAYEYGVSKRCIYRTLRRPDRPRHDVRLGDYRAIFEMTDEGPIQVTEWMAA